MYGFRHVSGGGKNSKSAAHQTHNFQDESGAYALRATQTVRFATVAAVNALSILSAIWRHILKGGLACLLTIRQQS
jgi:hypothetical protein